MNSRFFLRGTKVLVRRLGHSPGITNKPLPRRIEGEHYHNVLASRPGYYVGKVTSAEVEDKSEAVQRFIEASFYTLTPDVISGIVREAPNFSTTTVMALLLKIHSMMSPEHGRDVTTRCFPASMALCHRAHVLMELENSLKLEFTLADLFFRVHNTRPFASKMITRQSTALKYLTETDFIQHIFFSYSIRSLEPDTQKAIPIFVENVMDRLDFEEVALICFTLFSTQYRLSNDTQWLQIVASLERHRGPISDVSIGVFAKYLRYLNPQRNRESLAMKKFLQEASRRKSECSLSTHLRIANATTQAQLSNENFVRSAVPKLLDQLNTCRIKDVALCLYCNAFFNFKLDRKDAETIMRRLRREHVNAHFHQWLVKATLSLAMMGYYDECLLVKSLNRDIIEPSDTHQRSGFDLGALFTVCKIMFPHLLKDKITMTQKDFEVLQDREGKDETSSRYELDVQDVRSLIENELFLKTRSERILEPFTHQDIRIGDNIVIVLHTSRFYVEGGGLRGLRKFQSDLLRAAKYDVIELDRDFFKMTQARRKHHLRSELAKYLK